MSEEDRNLDAVESILEFLEEFAVFHKNNVFDDKLLWDSTIGWHATRYYIYNDENGNIGRLRDKWQDGSLYESLGNLWQRYLVIEARERGITKQHLLRQIRDTRQTFLEAERNACSVSKSPD